jgi:2-iminoacetate synthase
MSLCKSGQIQNCCLPNALLTLKEYLEDYASPATVEVGLKMIEKELENIPNPKVKEVVIEHLNDIHTGKRDFRF